MGRQPAYSLKFDKWLKDSHHVEMPCPYIEFEIEQEVMVAETSDDAPFVDARAFHKAVLLIADRQRTERDVEGELSFDGENWVTLERYRKITRDYVDCTFDEAMERTLKGSIE